MGKVLTKIQRHSHLMCYYFSKNLMHVLYGPYFSNVSNVVFSTRKFVHGGNGIVIQKSLVEI